MKKSLKKTFLRKSFALVCIFFVIFFLSGFGCKCNEIKQKAPVTLKIWNLWDDYEAYSEIIEAFEDLYPHVTIEYTKKELKTVDEDGNNTYENELLNDFAEGEGPDIFTIHNDWLPRYKSKMLYAPETYFNQDNLDYEDIFVDAVSHDFKDENGKIWGLPMTVDTLAMYYNKDILNSSGVVRPPETWEEFKEAVKKITKMSSNRSEIYQAGAVFGTASNVPRAQDILSLLMMQQCGTIDCMTNENNSMVTFDKSIEKNGVSFSPGETALAFYTDFSEITSPVYTWNQDIFKKEGYNYGIDAFLAGKAGFLFSYSYLIADIEKKNPGLNYDVAPVPQIANSYTKVNYPNYWAFGVYKNTKVPEEAWTFLKFLTQKNVASIYLEETNNPSSMRDFYESYYSLNSKQKVFMDQALTAKSWYKEDDSYVNNTFLEMINDVSVNKLSPKESIDNAVREINQIMDKEDDYNEENTDPISNINP